MLHLTEMRGQSVRKTNLQWILHTVLCCEFQQMWAHETGANAVLIPSLEQEAQDPVAIVHNSRGQRSLSCSRNRIDFCVVLEKEFGEFSIVGFCGMNEGSSSVYTALIENKSIPEGSKVEPSLWDGDLRHRHWLHTRAIS